MSNIRTNLKTALKDLVFKRVSLVFPKKEIKYRVTFKNHVNYEVVEDTSGMTIDEVDRQYTTISDYFVGETAPNSVREYSETPTKVLNFEARTFCYFDTIMMQWIPQNYTHITVPRKGDLICGLASEDRKSFNTWFICSEQFMRLWTMIMYDRHASFGSEEKLRKMATKGNYLCTNNFMKWFLLNQEAPQEEIEKRFFNLRYEFVGQKFFHTYPAIALIARWGEFPTEENVPNNLDDGPKHTTWFIPCNFVDTFVTLFQ